MRIDSHQHFWRFNPTDYGWMKPDWLIRRDFLPQHLESELRKCHLHGCVAVQARQSLEESRWLLELADASPIIRGVVGWVDLRSPDVSMQLERFAKHPRFVGVRHVVQDEPDDGFMLGKNFQRGIAALAEFDLTYDLLVFPRQLAAAITLAQKFPKQPFVLDHLAKPLIKDRVISLWREQIQELAKLPNVFCKISGMVTEADWQAWRADDFKSYLDVVFAAFGLDRLMFGSDWPVCLLAGSYERVFAVVDDYVSQLQVEDRTKFFGSNAASFYGLDS
ncbi:MAG TPA: amidohydrolase family protein [Verrucomicrobiae bacterium]|nr:amidohydrolase family protein [Verrucomicrobiae bacterium]